VSAKTPQEHFMRLIFQRVPFGVELVLVENGKEVYEILEPLSKIKGDWLWGGERAPKNEWEVSSPTFQYGTFRMWSVNRGDGMVATKVPDTDKLRKWVESIE
jgi:hypothetical protein